VNIRNNADAIMLRDQLLDIYPAKEFSVKIKTNINFNYRVIGSNNFALAITLQIKEIMGSFNHGKFYYKSLPSYLRKLILLNMRRVTQLHMMALLLFCTMQLRLRAVGKGDLRVNQENPSGVAFSRQWFWLTSYFIQGNCNKRSFLSRTVTFFAVGQEGLENYPKNPTLLSIQTKSESIKA